MDERDLLLLGLLRREEMHGYQLNQFLEHRLDSFLPMKRSTAYFLLGRLARHGLVHAELGREGRRPERRVYRLTPQGESALAEGLRRHLGEYHPATFPDAVGLFFLDMLPAAERVPALRGKLDELRERRLWAEERLRAHAGTRASWMMGHRVALLRAEEAWLEALIAEIEGAPAGVETGQAG